MNRWPLISAIDQACGELDAFKQATPMAQPDA
jgi:maleylpyruvate isomerase